MNLLIKQARIVDPLSPFHKQVTDIFIENGVITQIAPSITAKADQIINIENLHLSPGWVDVFANFPDPGYEFKETLETGAAAAAAGGFTNVFVIPNTNPVVHSKPGVEYIQQKNRSLPITIHPIGAITKNTDGKELAEMYDMQDSGAVAFSDGIHCIQSSGLMVKALQYVKAFDGVIIQLPDDKNINSHGLMNEGVVSTQMGLPGKPAMAEELIVERDIKLAAYTESNIHFTGISTKRSLEHIRQAKKEKIPVSCSITPYHIFFNETDLQQYNTNLKVNPPLRTAQDQKALQKAIQNGEVDCIATHHLPHEYDSKIVEFEYAKFGMIGLETAYAVLNTAIKNMEQEDWIKLLAINPRKIFGLPPVTIAKGQPASVTLFDPSQKWIVSEKDIHSKSKNTPFLTMELTGKVIGIINKDQLILNN
jgi:dihydroorotase